jgi:acetaldehyde dehydrogenase / alcohol dehydrogenase
MALDINQLMDNAVQSAREFRKLDQEATDKVVKAVYRAAFNARIELAKLACKETRLGVWQDKVIKNVIATKWVYDDIKDLTTAGIISGDFDSDIMEIAQPLGPIMAVTPITNPTSTVLFKILISLKSRNPIIIRPHGAAKKSTVKAARICYEAALSAGAPENCIQWVKRSTPEETQQMMGHKSIALNLATGSVDLVRAAQQSGNPTIGVGAGNVPVYMGMSADIPFAVGEIIKSKTFDNGTVCASEQALVVRSSHAAEVHAEFEKQGAYFVTEEEVDRLSEIAYNSTARIMQATVIGQSAETIAKMAGIEVPEGTKVLIAELDDVGKDHPLSHEILAPILASYTADSFDEAVEICKKINRLGGLGHTVSIFSSKTKMIKRFTEVMDAGRILVNVPASQGALGGTYNKLQPSMTLGCGAGGKNITSDNISARHLINIQRIANRRASDCIKNNMENLLNEEHTAKDEAQRCDDS